MLVADAAVSLQPPGCLGGRLWMLPCHPLLPRHAPPSFFIQPPLLLPTPPPPHRALWRSSSPVTPVMFVLSPGADPAFDVFRLGEEMGFKPGGK